MDKEIIVQRIIQIIRQYLSEGYKIVIFGSWAKGDALDTSDIDIGVLGKKKVAWSTLVKIKQAVDEIHTLRSIDIVDLNSVDESFKNNVLKDAKVLA